MTIPPRISRFTVILAAGMLAVTTSTPSGAAERAGINLGVTSFFDGFGSTDPGCTYLHYGGYNAFDTYNGPDGHTIADWSLQAAYTVQQIACNAGWTVLGTVPGAGVVVPIGGQDISPSPPLFDNGTGLGDIMLDLYLQFKPVKRGGRAVFSQAVGVDFLSPSGKYDVTKTVNPGNGYWSVNPLWRATVLPLPHWEISWRANYIHNFDHSPQGVKRHTGDGVWLNFTTSYEIFKDFYFGLNGYWLKQLEPDEIGGVAVPNTRQESLYVGPGFHYTFPSKDVLNFNVYLTVEDKNTFSDSVQVNFQYVHKL